MKGRIAISGALAQKPRQAGHTWQFLQYLLGFRRLGWDVLFIDWLDPDMCVDEAQQPCAVQDSVNLRYFLDVMKRFGLNDHFTLLEESGERVAGVSRADAIQRVKGSVLLLNVMGYLTDEDFLGAAPLRVFLDTDPGFGQMWQDVGLHDLFEGHDRYVTIGENIGKPDCSIPTCGLSWITTAQPVVLAEWPVQPPKSEGFFTSIGAWRGPYAPVKYQGQSYGLRVHEFRKVFELPKRTSARFQMALDIHPKEVADLEKLHQNGWMLIDPAQVARDPDGYRSYIRGSRAEFLVAKNMYVQSNSGWFSERSMCYLASGKPVLAQDTGLADLYPTDAGLLTYTTLEDAVAGVEQIMSDYERHCRAAREVAEAYFDSDKVLPRLLDKLTSPAVKKKVKPAPHAMASTAVSAAPEFLTTPAAPPAPPKSIAHPAPPTPTAPIAKPMEDTVLPDTSSSQSTKCGKCGRAIASADLQEFKGQLLCPQCAPARTPGLSVRTKKQLIIGAGAAAVVLIVAGTYFLVTRDRGTPEKTELTKGPPNIEKPQTRATAGDFHRSGQKKAEAKKYAEALSDFDRALEMMPDPRTYDERGKVHRSMGKPDLAIADFTKAIKLDPKNALLYIHRAQAYAAQHDQKSALADLDAAVKIDPSPTTLGKRAESLAAAKETDKALADYTEAIGMKPDKWLYMQRGNLYRDMGDTDKALADYAESLKSDPQYAPVYYNRGLMYKKAQQLDKALEDFDAAIKSNPKFAGSFIERGSLYQTRRLFDKAAADYAKAVELDPNNVVYLTKRGTALTALRQYDQAIADFDAALKVDPKHPVAFYERGKAHARKKELDRAIEDFTAALKLKEDKSAYLERANAYRDKKDYDAALKDYEQALTMDPKYAQAYRHRSLAFEAMKKTAEAQADFAKAVELDPSLKKSK